MANFFSNMMGNESIAKIAGEKVGDIVETAVNKAMSGGSEGKEGKEGGEGAGDAPKPGEEGKDDNKGGFGMDDALKLIGDVSGSGDKKEGDGKGLTEALGGFFK